MNEKYIHGTIISLLVIGLLMTGGSAYLLNNQIQVVSMEVRQVQGSDHLAQAPSIAVGEPNPSASGSAVSTITIGGLTFDLPKSWSSAGPGLGGDTLIRVGTSENMIPVNVHPLSKEESDKCKSSEYCDILTRSEHAGEPSVLYSADLLEVPSLGTWIVEKNGVYYSVSFPEPVSEPASDQPGNGEAEGVSFPPSPATQNQLLGFVLTVH